MNLCVILVFLRFSHCAQLEVQTRPRLSEPRIPVQNPLLWRTGWLQVIVPLELGRDLQIGAAESTGFLAGGVGMVGNQAPKSVVLRRYPNLLILPAKF